MRLNMRDWRLAALVGAALVFALLTGGNLPFALFYLLAGILVGGYAWTRFALQRIDSLIQVESTHIEVGGGLLVKVRIDNNTFLPLPWMEIDDGTPQHLVTTDLPRQATAVPLLGSRVVNFRLTARRRGHYAVGPIQVTLGDPFGLFQGIRSFESRGLITVFPRVHRIEGVPVPLSQPFGPVRTRERAFEDPSNQSEIRDYRTGDNPRHIHWKTSARLGELMVRQYELNATTTMVIFPDLCAASSVGESAETVIELAASITALGIQRKIDVGLVTYAQERFGVTAVRGQRGFQEILEVLARVEATGIIPIDQVLEREAAHLSGKATLVVITACLTPRLADMLIRLRANHQIMLILLDAESYAPHVVLDPEAAAASEWNPLSATTLIGLLLLKRVAVYIVAASDDLRRLADFRLTAGSEGVRAWSQGARASGTRS
jgi:uncharacterized protein (DUF58 family)